MGTHALDVFVGKELFNHASISRVSWMYLLVGLGSKKDVTIDPHLLSLKKSLE